MMMARVMVMNIIQTKSPRSISIAGSVAIVVQVLQASAFSLALSSSPGPGNSRVASFQAVADALAVADPVCDGAEDSRRGRDGEVQGQGHQDARRRVDEVEEQ